MKLDDLKQVLINSYSAKTCHEEYKEEFKQNKFRGQCVVTALIVQDYFGGKILRTEIDGERHSHYFNEIDGKTIDLTAEQFGLAPEYKNVEERNREKLLSDRNTENRYKVLTNSVKDEFCKRG